MRSEPIFWVDVPNPDATEANTGWMNVAEFDTYHEAVAYIRNCWGDRAAEHADLFITEGLL